MRLAKLKAAPAHTGSVGIALALSARPNPDT